MANWVDQNFHVVGRKSAVDRFVRAGYVPHRRGEVDDLLYLDKLCPPTRSEKRAEDSPDLAVVLALFRTRTQAMFTMQTRSDYPAGFYRRLPAQWPELAFAASVNEEMGSFGGNSPGAGTMGRAADRRSALARDAGRAVDTSIDSVRRAPGRWVVAVFQDAGGDGRVPGAIPQFASDAARRARVAAHAVSRPGLSLTGDSSDRQSGLELIRVPILTGCAVPPTMVASSRPSRHGTGLISCMPVRGSLAGGHHEGDG